MQIRKNNLNLNITLKSCTLYKVLCVACFLGLTASVSSQVYFSNKYAVKGDEIKSLTSKRAELKREVSKLELEVSSLSSLSLVETKAEELGFVHMTNQLGFIGPSAVAVSLR